VPGQLKSAVVGATGYAGFELARLLLRHPRLAPPLFFSRDTAERDTDLGKVFPHLSGNASHKLLPLSPEELERHQLDLLFFATPHELSREWIPKAVARGVRVVDLSGAWRLKEAAHRKIYGFDESDGCAAKLAEAAVYGLPELHRDRVHDAQLVANPGCYATSVILALAPLVRAGLVASDSGIVCDCKSGVSGAGKQPTPRTHFVEVAENLSVYSAFGHRHTGEILEQVGLDENQLTFTPHLLPIARGILSTIYLRLNKPVEPGEIEQCLRDSYSGCAWVRVFPPPQLPQIQYCARTNFCDLGFNLSPAGTRLVLVSCLDNLMKGAAGQAVQNMNVMYGWGEQEGLN
jgi:N-acetyl-gamma-glutamyl-phosphate reductase